MIRKSNKRYASEINVTPFVDVLLIILIIFMITAPMMTTEFEVSLPETSNNEIQKSISYLTLTVDRKADIYYEKKIVNNRLKFLLENYNKESTHVLIRADKNVRYEAVIGLMNELKILGFLHISLITEVK